VRGRRRRTRRAVTVLRLTDTRGLLAAKFARPQVPAALVVRRRLLDRLDEAARGEVTLIVAGPGYGKTLLVAAWADTGRPPGRVAWLSLDRYDDSPAAFWSYFLGALRSTGAVAPEKSAFVDSTADPAGRPVTPSGDAITDREMDVLRYLPTMLRNQDIAAQLYVTVNTVKAHLRSLYHKLGVTQRREAVERARELGLL